MLSLASWPLVMNRSLRRSISRAPRTPLRKTTTIPKPTSRRGWVINVTIGWQAITDIDVPLALERICPAQGGDREGVDGIDAWETRGQVFWLDSNPWTLEDHQSWGSGNPGWSLCQQGDLRLRLQLRGQWSRHSRQEPDELWILRSLCSHWSSRSLPEKGRCLLWRTWSGWTAAHRLRVWQWTTGCRMSGCHYWSVPKLHEGPTIQSRITVPLRRHPPYPPVPEQGLYAEPSHQCLRLLSIYLFLSHSGPLAPRSSAPLVITVALSPSSRP